MGTLIQIGMFGGMILLGFLWGRFNERRHWKSLDERKRLLPEGFVISNQRTVPGDLDVASAFFCSGVVVIASDYYKSFFSLLKNLIGGHIRTYETLIERGRREAIMRAVEEAIGRGAHAVYNVRVETSTIGRSGGNKGLAMCEVLAYGTAVVLKSPGFSHPTPETPDAIGE